MVTVTKGSRTLVVPVGAYKTTYAPAGWVLQGEVEVSAPEKPVEEKKAEEPKAEKPVEKPEPETEDEDEAEDEAEDEDVEYVDPEELLEKPLEELDFEELKILAEYLEIDTKGMTTSKALRSAIKKAQK